MRSFVYGVAQVHIRYLVLLLLLVGPAIGCSKGPGKTESESQLPPKTEEVSPPALGPPPP